jgi:response regulator RpfG family c-di-GMP phosphodiesterase
MDGGTERVLLLVDDEENILSSLKRLLRRDGYKILHANGGQEGLDVLARESVGVVISDQRMPQMTGVEFLHQVRDRHPQTVRLMLSGYSDLKSVTDAINEGAIYKFLTKPWDDELLRKNVAEAFEQYELRRRNRRLTDELQKANEELLRLNQGLEQRVQEKMQETLRSLQVLQIAQEVLESLPLGVIGVDDEGVIVTANHKALALLGHEAVVGCEAAQVLPGFAQSGPQRLALPAGDIEVSLHPLGMQSGAKGIVVLLATV